MGEMVRKKICSDIRDAGVYSILAHESKDCSKTEQLAIIIRYVSVKDGTVHERFLTFVEASSLDAKSLTEYILTTLRNQNLDVEALVSQGYDGRGVARIFLKGVLSLVSLARPFLQLVRCIVLASLAT